MHEAGIITAIVTSKTKKTTLHGLTLFNLDQLFSGNYWCRSVSKS
ncbi:hypothetical protein [Pelosinus fermentans]